MDDIVGRVAEKLKAEKLDKFSSEQTLELIEAVTNAIEAHTPAPRKAVAQFANKRGIALTAGADADEATRISTIIEEELARFV